MVSIKKHWVIFIVVLLLIGWIMPTTSAAVDYKNIRVRITMATEQIKSVSVVLNGDYALMQDPALTLPQGSYSIKVEADGTNLRLTGNGIDRVVGTEIRFIRLKYSSTTVSRLQVNGTEYGNVNYLGDMRFHTSFGSILVTNHVPLEEYLYGVVAYEMSNSFPLEALKAQAVAARGYAIRKIEVSEKRDYDIVDTTSDQVYKGFVLKSGSASEPKYATVVKAVNETKGQVVTYNNKIAETYYSASNGGQMDLVGNVWPPKDKPIDKNALYPYLVMQDDPYDLKSPENFRTPSSTLQTVFLPAQVSGTKDDVIASEKVVRVINISTYLNIRSAPNTSSDIIHTATLNQLFAYVETHSSGWYKIQFYKDGGLKEGFVSPDYSQVEANTQNGYMYANPILSDLQEKIFGQIGASNSIANANMIKINRVDRFVNGKRRWPEPSRSFVTAIADVKIQHKKADGSLSNEMEVKDISIDLMKELGKDANGNPIKDVYGNIVYVHAHPYLNGNLRMRGVRDAVKDGVEGFEITNARFGHGLGMSQRGAQQMAVEGKKYDEILAFYYVGTVLKNYETGVPVLPDRGDVTPPADTVPAVTSTVYKIGTNSIAGIQEKTSVSTFVDNFAIQNGTLALVGSDNKAKTTGNVATGDVLYVKDGAGKIVKSYTIVIYGDVNGDGSISIADLLGIQKHLLDVKKIAGVYQSAGDVNKDGKVSIADLLGTQRHLLEISKISQ